MREAMYGGWRGVASGCTRGVSEREGWPLHSATSWRGTSTAGSSSTRRERVKVSGSVMGIRPSGVSTGDTVGCGTVGER